MNLFTYGSLMFAPVWRRVVGGVYANSEAVLFGYQRRQISGRIYPALTPGADGQRVDGRVYFDLGASDIRRLDAFEGEHYRRIETACRLPDGHWLPVDVYLFKSRYRHLLLEKNWDADRFASEGIQAFLSGYEGFGRR